MARISGRKLRREAEALRPDSGVLPEWIRRQVSQMPSERVYCLDGKVRTIGHVRQINRARGQVWYVVTTLEEEMQERSICEMEPDEPMAAHAKFIECEPDYLDSYRSETVSLRL